MILEKKEKEDKRVIYLDSPDGNAFNLLAIANSLTKQLGMKPRTVTSKMMKGNYDNLVKVFDEYFGSIYTLVKKEIKWDI